jgi:hypothetical protein
MHSSSSIYGGWTKLSLWRKKAINNERLFGTEDYCPIFTWQARWSMPTHCTVHHITSDDIKDSKQTRLARTYIRITANRRAICACNSQYICEENSPYTYMQAYWYICTWRWFIRQQVTEVVMNDGYVASHTETVVCACLEAICFLPVYHVFTIAVYIAACGATGRICRGVVLDGIQNIWPIARLNKQRINKSESFSIPQSHPVIAFMHLEVWFLKTC